MLPTGTVGHADHEVVVARVDVGGNLDELSRRERGGTRWDGKILVVDPRVDGVLLGIHLTLHRRGTVGVMVEIVVNLDVVVTQFVVVAQQIAERHLFATTEGLAVGGTGIFDRIGDGGFGHVFLVVRAATGRQGNEQEEGEKKLFHINELGVQKQTGAADASAINLRPPSHRGALMLVVVIVVIIILDAIVLNEFDVTLGSGLLASLIHDDEVQMIFAQRSIGRDVDVLVELGILQADILRVGIGFLNLEAMRGLLMNLNVNALDEPLGHDIGLQMEVMTRVGMAAVVVPHLGEGDDRLGDIVVVIVVA